MNTFKITIYTDNKVLGLSLLRITEVERLSSKVKFILLSKGNEEIEIPDTMTEDEFNELTGMGCKWESPIDFYISGDGLQKMIAALS